MPRTGKGGAANPNRTDLNTAAPTGDQREWGSNQRDQQALDALPMEVQRQATPRTPGDMGGLSRPSARPNEPITAGVDIGAGPGSDALLTSQRMMSRRADRRAGLYAQRLVEVTGDPELMKFLNAVSRRGRR